jgi:tetraacyldisaccharide 4'-kinase
VNPLSAIFGSAVALRNTLYDRGIFKIHRLERPVISVGNLSVGGSGKTPFVIALGELLKARSIAFDVLSRGYGRSAGGISLVDPTGSPEQYGDEPLLIASKLQVPVIVGADRYQAGLLAEEKFPSRLHLLDDAFQHRRLHRDFEIVMLPPEDLNGILLPAGRLREPLSSLRRADVAVISPDEGNQTVVTSLANNHAGSLDTIEQAMEFEEESQPGLQVLPVETWRIRRSIYLEEAPKRPVAFCGIARPQQFFSQLHDLGIEIGKAVTFSDHHRYSEKDVSRLLGLKSASEAGGFITTEKDKINLGSLADRLQPLAIAQLRLVLRDPQEALSTLFSTLENRSGCRF